MTAFQRVWKCAHKLLANPVLGVDEAHAMWIVDTTASSSFEQDYNALSQNFMKWAS